MGKCESPMLPGCTTPPGTHASMGIRPKSNPRRGTTEGNKSPSEKNVLRPKKAPQRTRVRVIPPFGQAMHQSPAKFPAQSRLTVAMVLPPHLQIHILQFITIHFCYHLTFTPSVHVRLFDIIGNIIDIKFRFNT